MLRQGGDPGGSCLPRYGATAPARAGPSLGFRAPRMGGRAPLHRTRNPSRQTSPHNGGAVCP
jgi:hypothetical protein